MRWCRETSESYYYVKGLVTQAPSKALTNYLKVCANTTPSEFICCKLVTQPFPVSADTIATPEDTLALASDYWLLTTGFASVAVYVC